MSVFPQLKDGHLMSNRVITALDFRKLGRIWKMSQYSAENPLAYTVWQNEG